MALQVLEFEFKSAATQEIAKEWSHLGVTGSGKNARKICN